MSCWLCVIVIHLAALYLAAVASFSALVGQHVVRKVIKILGRASIIIFILSSTIFVSAISLGMYKHHFYEFSCPDHDMDLAPFVLFFFFP